MQKYAKKIVTALILIMPLALFLSYHPVISLGANSAMNFEFSIAEIWLCIFCLVSLFFIKKVMRYYGWKKLCLAALIPAYFTVSAAWSTNRIRTLLTAGIFWLIVFAALNLIFWLKNDNGPELRRKLVKSLLITAVGVSVFCWAQCTLDLAGVARDYTLLCQGCISTKFGFPHPNGFAIEPQFMGNLLLAPVLLGFYLLISPTERAKKPSQRIVLFITTIFLTATLFLTFSRGAIYAFIIGLILEIILAIAQYRCSTPKHRKKVSLKTTIFQPVLIAAIAFTASLCAQGLFAAMGPTNDTFYSGIAKAVHQLSLGKIDIRSTDVTQTQQDQNQPEEQSSQFTGYVAESTDVRLSLNQIAIRTWQSNAQYLLVGTGLGGAGVAMNAAFPDELGPKEIVQNEYVSLLLETGIIGYAIILAVTFASVKYIIVNNKKAHLAFAKQLLLPLFAGISLAFLLSLLFFSGLPNAIHIYLFPLIFIGLGSAKNDTIVE